MEIADAIVDSLLDFADTLEQEYQEWKKNDSDQTQQEKAKNQHSQPTSTVENPFADASLAANLLRRLTEVWKPRPQAPSLYFERLCSIYLVATSEQRVRIRDYFKDRPGVQWELSSYSRKKAQEVQLEHSIDQNIKVIRLVLAGISIENTLPDDWYETPETLIKMTAQAKRQGIDVDTLFAEIIAISDKIAAEFLSMSELR